MLSNMASSLILHKRISTTLAKAKALRQYVEPLITKSKSDTTQNRRVVFSYLQDKETVKVLFDEVSEKITARPGGYTRIIKIGNRLGDNAEMCIMELVDFNELLLAEKEPQKVKTRRSRRGGKKSEEGTDAVNVELTPKAKKSAPAVETEVEEPEGAEPVKVEEVAPEVVEEVTSEAQEEKEEKAPEGDEDEESKKE